MTAASLGDPIEGVFRELPADPHLPRRIRLLRRCAALPSPPVPTIRARAASFPGQGAGTLLAEAGQRGLAVMQLDEPLGSDQFAALGSLLGTAMAETDPAVQPYAENDVILNIVSGHDETDDISRQPFAANFLALHSESSGRSAGQQPRFIVLMCCEPGAADAAQTVLIPMAGVDRLLTSEQRDLLAWTRYRHSHHGPWIRREIAGRPVFSFRDFTHEALEWTYAGSRPPAGVNGAFRALLAAMYEPVAATGLRWERGMLAVIDNTFFFHGRTTGSTATGGNRHLKRLRIIEGEPGI